MLQYIQWHPSPNIFDLGFYALRWYGAMFALCILLGFFIAQHLYRLQKINDAQLSNAIMYIFFGGIIGARLGQVLFYELDYFTQHPAEIIKVWKGGLASHGGGIGVLIGLYLYNKIYKTANFIQLLDICAVIMPLIGALIRIGNLFNSEIIGIPTTVPWAFVFSNIDDVPRHPSQVYEAIMLFLVFIFMLLLYIKKWDKLPVGTFSGLFFIIVFSFRFILEFWKLDAKQWLNIPFIVLGILLLLLAQKKYFGNPINTLANNNPN